MEKSIFCIFCIFGINSKSLYFLYYWNISKKYKKIQKILNYCLGRISKVNQKRIVVRSSSQSNIRHSNIRCSSSSVRGGSDSSSSKGGLAARAKGRGGGHVAARAKGRRKAWARAKVSTLIMIFLSCPQNDYLHLNPTRSNCRYKNKLLPTIIVMSDVNLVWDNPLLPHPRKGAYTCLSDPTQPLI